MDYQKFIRNLVIKTPSKIILVVIDGLGGLPNKEGQTELEKANTFNLDKLAKNSICGLIHPIAPGITPGSGPAHLSLFGYNPLKYTIGRGLLSALGIGFELQPNDLTVRGNFATINQQGIITDRRAGRLSTEKTKNLCKILEEIKLEKIEFFIRAERDHRFAIVFRGENLSDKLTDSDPQKIGILPYKISAKEYKAERTAQIINEFVSQAKEKLKENLPANMILLRGFAQYTKLPNFEEIYKLKAAAIATYPMYKGLSKLLGMELLSSKDSIEEEFITLEKYYKDYDFFYLHIKKTDSAGEDGNFEEKVLVLEEIDKYIPKLINLNPECLIVTGDHSTPAVFKAHSWHPVPVLLYSKNCYPDKVMQFSERECGNGGLGLFFASELMCLALAHSEKLIKFGA